MVLHQRKPNRLQEYNYSQPGHYFVTICTHRKKDWFGDFINDEIALNNYGKVAKQCWEEIPAHFENVYLDEYIVLPNHIHGILIVNTLVGNRHACSLRRQNQTLPVVIGSFKSAVSKSINDSLRNDLFRWQKSFYDHVIRNEKSLYKIRHYINQNAFKHQLQIEEII